MLGVTRVPSQRLFFLVWRQGRFVWRPVPPGYQRKGKAVYLQLDFDAVADVAGAGADEEECRALPE